jgi:hypothetical protein
MSLELIELPSYPQDPLLDDLCQVIENAILSLGANFKFAIAGGYVRDWYQNQPANDIDIYLYDPTSLDYLANEAFASILCDKSFVKSFFSGKKSRLDLKRSSRTKHFLDTIFTTSDYSPVRVQFILSPIRGVVSHSLRYKGIEDILTSFDFTHCQFAFSPHDLKAFTTQDALSSLETKTLQLTSRMNNEISRLMNQKIFTPTNLFEIENFTKRVIKFVTRGMLPPSLDITNLIETYYSNVKMESLSTVLTPSSMLGGVDHYDILSASSSNTERFTQDEIVKNLIIQWLSIAPIEDVARCIVSPYNVIRSAAEAVASLRLKT